MRGIAIRTLVSVLLVACSTLPAPAGAPAGARDSSAVPAADTSAANRVAAHSPAVPSLVQSARAAEALAATRGITGHAVRVTVCREEYELTRASFDSTGVVFTPDEEQGMPRWPVDGSVRLASPVAWEQVECVRVQQSHAGIGAVVGMAVASIAVVAVISGHHASPNGPDLEQVVLPPAGLALGALVGAFVGGTGSWPVAWQRTPAPDEER